MVFKTEAGNHGAKVNVAEKKYRCRCFSENTVSEKETMSGSKLNALTLGVQCVRSDLLERPGFKGISTGKGIFDKL